MYLYNTLYIKASSVTINFTNNKKSKVPHLIKCDFFKYKEWKSIFLLNAIKLLFFFFMKKYLIF